MQGPGKNLVICFSLDSFRDLVLSCNPVHNIIIRPEMESIIWICIPACYPGPLGMLTFPVQSSIIIIFLHSCIA